MKFEDFSPTPPEKVLLIANLIKNKDVCDLGSGDGVWMREMAEFASSVNGIEIDPKYTINPKDFFDENLSGFEVLYMNTNDDGGLELGKKLKKDNWHGVVITYGQPLFKDSQPDEVRETFLIYKL